jgi:glycine cleavage system H protein
MEKSADLEYPEDLKYTEQHEWVRVEGGRATVGITDFAQSELGDVVYVDVPEAGASVTAGSPFGEVESTKSVSDVYAPLSGTVAERNERLADNPELVNEQPYGDGWMIVVELSDASEVDRLMDAAAYRALTQSDSGDQPA